MIRKDFIERLIEQLGEALQRIGRRREKGEPSEALADVRACYRELAGFDPGLVGVLDAPALLTLLPRPEHAPVVVALARCEVEILSELGQRRAARALALAALALAEVAADGQDAEAQPGAAQRLGERLRAESAALRELVRALSESELSR